MIHNIECRFCGKTIGTLDLSEKDRFNRPIPQEKRDAALAEIRANDSRCNDCIALYGTVQEMERESEAQGIRGDDFKALMEKAEWKREKFDKEIGKIKKNVV